jgi:phytanoyl-CoA dioxygenase PhyH
MPDPTTPPWPASALTDPAATLADPSGALAEPASALAEAAGALADPASAPGTAPGPALTDPATTALTAAGTVSTLTPTGAVTTLHGHREQTEPPAPGEFVLTEAEASLLPTDEDVAWYAEHGWYLSKKLLSDEEIATLVSASERFYGGHRDRVLPHHPPTLAYWEPSRGEVQRHNDYIHYECDAIAAILRKPLIGAVAARLAGTGQIRVWQSTLIYKPPASTEITNLVPWHADRHYWQTCTSDSMLTAFIPFHHCGPDMGTITMVDGSHRWREIEGDDSTRHFAQRDHRQRHPDRDPAGPHELPPLPHLPRQRAQPFRPAAPRHLPPPARRRQPLAGVPQARRRPAGVQPRHAGPQDGRGYTRLR